jgi:hypothetical protein
MTIALWSYAAVNGLVGALMFYYGERDIAIISLISVVALSWAGYLSRQTDRRWATQDLGGTL